MPLRLLLVLVLLALPRVLQADEVELPLQALVRTLSAERLHPYVDWRGIERHLDPVRRFYAARGWEPAWTRQGEPTPQLRELLLELREARHKGLDPGDYDGLRLTYLLIDIMTNPDAAPEDWALWDVAMSAALSRYVSDLHFGRVDPATLGLGLVVDRGRLDVATILAAIAGSGDPRMVLADIEPGFRTYEILKRVLAHYRELTLEPDFTALPPLPGRSLRPGEPWTGASALRRLLVALGDLPAGAPPVGRLYDERLAAGVRAFQQRHGLEADGTIGQRTWRELTTPLAARVRQIELSLERWRWVPPRLDSPPIVVNIPQYKLFAFRDTSDDVDHMLVMDVVVGSAFRETLTPVFSADMTHLVFRPYWDVPWTIATREILPQARADRRWLESNGFEIVNGFGDDAPVVAVDDASLAAVAVGTARIRQKPGPGNSLGRVKFMLPNRYNVYLHDTPAGHLFARARRDFSHGCVRLSDPVALAQFVLRDDPAWTPERIAEAMSAEVPATVRLPRPIRVYFVYQTAIASARRVFFFEDIYGQDVALDAALKRNSG